MFPCQRLLLLCSGIFYFGASENVGELHHPGAKAFASVPLKQAHRRHLQADGYHHVRHRGRVHSFLQLTDARYDLDDVRQHEWARVQQRAEAAAAFDERRDTCASKD